MINKKMLMAILLTVLLNSCQSNKPISIEKEFLLSWNDGAAKQRITSFVNSITDQTSSNYVPPGERIATFDNDGTLWAEQPMYFQVQFVFDRVKELAENDESLKKRQPYKAIIEGDNEYLSKLGSHGLTDVFTFTHTGMSNTEFREIASTWLDTAKHPKFNKPYTSFVYKPMLELLDYLRENEFKVYICSGGSVEFIRAFADEVYGIPPEQVIGTSYKYEFINNDKGISINRTTEINSFNDKQEKANNIQLHIGRKPLVAVGNSDGDLQMLQFSASRTGSSLQLLLHHNDAEREWAYDRESKIGRLDKALDEAVSRDWTVISMQKDWAAIFPK